MSKWKKLSGLMLCLLVVFSVVYFIRFESLVVGAQLWISFSFLLLGSWCFYWKHILFGAASIFACMAAALIEYVP